MKPPKSFFTNSCECFSEYAKSTWSQSTTAVKKWPFLQAWCCPSLLFSGCTSADVASVEITEALSSASRHMACTMVAPSVPPASST